MISDEVERLCSDRVYGDHNRSGQPTIARRRIKSRWVDLEPRSVWSDALALGAQPLFVIGFILYGLAAVLWFSVLPRVDLSISYPVLVGLTFVLVVSGSMVVFNENLPWAKVLGMALILAGVALVARA